MRRTVVALACSTALAGLGLSALAAPAATGPRFGAPVLLTIDKYTGGYEPSIAVDRFNNIYVTAHKQNHSLVVSPDSRSTTGARSQSWLWTSKDGKAFTDMPGLTPVQEQNYVFGDEGDVAVDDTGHMYFVDTSVTDNSFSRYKATGNGKLALETVRPVGPFGEPVDDRPWITAHGDGVVLYTGNQGDKVSYPAGQTGGDGAAYGPGRYTVYMSYDHGDTFDPLGITLADSGWCRPTADHRKGSKDLYMLCTNDAEATGTEQVTGYGGGKGTLWAYSSHDDGRTWSRSRMGGYRGEDPIQTWPSVTVGKDGTVYALYNDSRTETTEAIPGVPAPETTITTPVDSHLWLYTSKDRGRTWASRDVTPRKGGIRYSWLDVAPDGTLGIAYYYREKTTDDWYVYAATAKPGKAFTTSKVSGTRIASKGYPSGFGDFFQIAFGPDSKLNVAWTVQNEDLLAEGLNTDIYYAKQK